MINIKMKNMSFDLILVLHGLEFKKPNVSILDFLDINKKMAEALNDIFSYKIHVNFAETIIDQIIFKGTIDTVFNHKKLISALKKAQEECNSVWIGKFNYNDNKSSFSFSAPKFILEKKTF